MFNLSWYLFYNPLPSAIRDLELVLFSNLVMNLLKNSWKFNNSITNKRSNVTHPLNCALYYLLSYFTILVYFHFIFILLDLFVLLFYFHFIRFAYSLWSTTPDSNTMDD